MTAKSCVVRSRVQPPNSRHTLGMSKFRDFEEDNGFTLKTEEEGEQRTWVHVGGISKHMLGCSTGGKEWLMLNEVIKRSVWDAIMAQDCMHTFTATSSAYDSGSTAGSDTGGASCSALCSARCGQRPKRE